MTFSLLLPVSLSSWKHLEEWEPIGTHVIEVTEFNLEVSLDLGGRLEAETAKNKSDQSYPKI